MNKWGYSYLIVLKTLWEKEKLLITSNFSFSHNAFKNCLLLMRKNEYLWSKGLTLYQMTKFKALADDSLDVTHRLKFSLKLNPLPNNKI